MIKDAEDKGLITPGKVCNPNIILHFEFDFLDFQCISDRVTMLKLIVYSYDNMTT